MDPADSPRKKGKTPKGLSDKELDAFDQLLDAAIALQRQNRNLHSSAVKEAMKRKQPQFSEEYHGYSSFSHSLKRDRDDSVTPGWPERGPRLRERRLVGLA